MKFALAGFIALLAIAPLIPPDCAPPPPPECGDAPGICEPLDPVTCEFVCYCETE